MKEKTRAILYIIMSGAAFSFMNVFVRLSGDLTTIEKAFFRNLIAAIIAFIILMRSGIGLKYEKQHVPMLLLQQ